MKMDSSFWAGEWERVQSKTGHSSDSSYWDESAPRFRKKPGKGQKDDYPERFYELMNPRKDDVIFDMGCGSGVLSIPFAEKGHKIICADFSRGMLDTLMEGAREDGVEDRIEALTLDWREDWGSRNLPVCDVAVSSRSLMGLAPREAMLKLESVARREVCLGLWTHGEFAYEPEIARAIGYEGVNPGIFEYILNMLLAMGRRPALDYIYSHFRPKMYSSFEECLRINRESFPTALNDEQERKLEKYIEDNLIPYSDKRGKGLILRGSEITCFAFIKWQVLHD